LEQNRFSSATDGSVSTTDAGSGTGAAGTVVIPAPRCCAADRVDNNRRVGRDPARAEPMGDVESREDTPVPVVTPV
jgi:hypothetical protein